MKPSLFSFLAVLVLTSATHSRALQAETPASTITSRANLVVVPVVVTGKHGNHMANLTKDDFRVEEEGKAQPIARFEEISANKTPMHRATGPVPNSYTNEVVGDPSSRVLVIIALDFLNTTWADEVFARRSLLKYLAESVKEDTLVSLVTIDQAGLHQIHDFTTDPAVLVAALKSVTRGIARLDTNEQQAQTQGLEAQNRVTLAESGALSNLLNPDVIKLVAQPRIINAQAAASREAFAIRITLEAMQHLAQAYAAVPGRKALIWATGSFPFLMHDQTEMSYGGLSPDVYQRTFQMLDDANIAAYPVDIRGLSPGSDDYDANRPRDMSRSIATRAQTLRASEMPNPESVRELSLSTLRSFADMTGGQAFYNANDLQQSMAHATDDSSSYYLLTYYLSKDSAKKSGWHKLKVTVAHEGVGEVRARKGFFVSKTTLDPENSRRNDEQVALDSPLDYTAMPMLLTWRDIQSGQKRNKANFILQVAPEVIRIQEHKISLDFVGIARNEKGEQVAQFSQSLANNLSPDGERQIQTGGITYANAFQLPAGDYNVRVVVRDNFTGLMGSVLAPLRVQ